MTTPELNAIADAITSAALNATATTTSSQRLFLTVPTPSTTLSMGKRHASGNGVDGFSVWTSSHLFMQGTSDDSTATVETPGEVSITSTSSTMTLSSKDDYLLFSEQDGYIAARKSLMISSGGEGPQTVKWGIWNDPAEAGKLPTDQVAGHMDKVRGTVEDILFWSGIGTTALSIAVGLVSRTWQKPMNIALAVGTVVSQLSRKIFKPRLEGEVFVYGAEAATISSANSVSLASANGASIIAPFISIWSGLVTSISTPGQLSLNAIIGASMSSLREVKLTAGRTLDLSSRTGVVTMRGLALKFGTMAYDVPQAATSVIDMIAGSTITLATGILGTVLKLGTTGIDANGVKHTIVARDQVTVASGAFGLDVGMDGAALVNTVAPVGAAAFAGTAAGQKAYEAQVLAAEQAAAVASAAVDAAPVDEGVPLMVAAAAYVASMNTIKTTLQAATKLAKKVAGHLRIGVSSTKAEMAGGIGKISIDALGNITIDGMGMPVTIKSGAGSIMVTAAGVKIGPIIQEG